MSSDARILDYGMGNVGSLVNLIRYLGLSATMAGRPEDLKGSAPILIPGNGHFLTAMNNLKERELLPALQDARLRGVPILGICVGLQLMCQRSEEGNAEGLGWLDCEVRKFSGVRPDGSKYPVPHMGWSSLQIQEKHSAAALLPMPSRFYFVHSFYVTASAQSSALATYGDQIFSAACGKDNIGGVQFHPEKSHRFGMQFMANYFGVEV
ncbi:MAG: imidazole glycerol phosphate synthase subunit HisH [Bdellovibrionales bacterium]